MSDSNIKLTGRAVQIPLAPIHFEILGMRSARDVSHAITRNQAALRVERERERRHVRTFAVAIF